MRVLIVEDEDLLGATVKRGLEAEGYVAVLSSNGIDGLWQASEEQFDVVVLDIMMPGLNGYEVLRQMRAKSIWTPVMMLTAKDGDFDQTDAFDLGADDYLTKPFSFVVFLARLRALVRRGGPERPAVLTAAGLSLDPSLRRVDHDGSEIKLTPKEYALLEFFIRHADEVVTKTEILQNVWDAHYEGDDNVVEVYVGYLRRKINASGHRNSIETLRGAGYRLVSKPI